MTSLGKVINTCSDNPYDLYHCIHRTANFSWLNQYEWSMKHWYFDVFCFLHPIIVQYEWSMKNWLVNITCVSASNFSGSNHDGLPPASTLRVPAGSQEFHVTSPRWRFTQNMVDAYRINGLCKAYVYGNIPTKYGLIWYSTSILGSWNSH